MDAASKVLLMKNETKEPDHSKGVFVYTDGSFRRPNFGSFSWLVIKNGEVVAEYVEKVKDTTINRMELSAIKNVLEQFEAGTELTIFTDSQYARNCCAQWMHGWARRGWMTPLMNPVQNQDIIKDIMALDKKLKVKYVWIRSHCGIKYNERVDTLAQDATKEMVLEEMQKKKDEAAKKIIL